MSQISQIDIVINEGIHMDHKNKIDLVFTAVCLHFTAVLVKFAEKTSAIKGKCPQ